MTRHTIKRAAQLNLLESLILYNIPILHRYFLHNAAGHYSVRCLDRIHLFYKTVYSLTGLKSISRIANAALPLMFNCGTSIV
jgi:hypothetical protein